MEKLETPTPASSTSKAQLTKMLPLLTYPFSAFAVQQISLTGFKYKLLACVRKLENQSDFDAIMAQLDILQKKNKMTDADYQSSRAIVLGRSADDTYFQPPSQQKSKPTLTPLNPSTDLQQSTNLRQRISMMHDKSEEKLHKLGAHRPVQPQKTTETTPQQAPLSPDQQSTLFYTQKKGSAKKNNAAYLPSKEIQFPEKKPKLTYVSSLQLL